MLLSNQLIAQETEIESIAIENQKKTNSLKYYFSDLLNPLSPAFQLAFERRFSEKFAAEISAGYVTSFEGNWVVNNSMTGYLLRAEAKLILSDNEKAETYLAFQAMFKDTQEDDFGRFSRFNNSFQQLIQYQTDKEEMAGHFNGGVKLFATQSLFFEFAGGIGIRINNKTYNGVPADAESLEDAPFIEFNPRGKKALPSAYLKVGIGVEL